MNETNIVGKLSKVSFETGIPIERLLNEFNDIQDFDLIQKKAIFEYILSKQYYSTSIFTNETKKKVFKRAKGKCEKCGSEKDLEFDHIIPKSKKGNTTYQNCQLLCRKCNTRKYNKITIY